MEALNVYKNINARRIYDLILLKNVITHNKYFQNCSQYLYPACRDAEQDICSLCII